MRTEKKTIEFADFVVTIIVRPKKPPKATNDNEKAANGPNITVSAIGDFIGGLFGGFTKSVGSGW